MLQVLEAFYYVVEICINQHFLSDAQRTVSELPLPTHLLPHILSKTLPLKLSEEDVYKR